MPNIPKGKLGTRDKTFLAFGKAMAEWALLERALYDWFEHLTLLSEPRAKAIYFAAKNTSNRLDLLRAAIGTSGIEADAQNFITEAIKRVVNYSTFRNKLAHGEFTFEGQIIESKLPRKTAREKAVTKEQLEIAIGNLTILTTAIRSALDFAKGMSETEEESLALCLQQVLESPLQADSTTSNQKSAKR